MTVLSACALSPEKHLCHPAVLPACLHHRIQFEVSVRVLGGLMSLGYQIGTIMRRTSNLMRNGGGDITVKFDDVENLGKFVQVSRNGICRVVGGCSGDPQRSRVHEQYTAADASAGNHPLVLQVVV